MARVSTSGKLTAADDKVISADKIYNALLRTTCVTTMLQASTQENVLPTRAEAVVNCRILPGESPESTLAALQKLLGDPALELTADRNKGYAAGSPVDGEVMTAIAAVAARQFPGVPVVPTMTLGATDSRHLRAVGMHAYGISATPIALDETRAGHGAHGPDERRPVAFLAPGVRFLRELTLELAR
jgi:acetylornithine deacetylase/succinyl-diaminopimelate desuccinylase-like protein